MSVSKNNQECEEEKPGEAALPWKTCPLRRGIPRRLKLHKPEERPACGRPTESRLNQYRQMLASMQANLSDGTVFFQTTARGKFC